MQKGSVFKVLNTEGKLISWGWRIQTGRTASGKKIQSGKRGFETKHKAQKALDDFKKTLEVEPVVAPGAPVDGDLRTFNWWLNEYLDVHCVGAAREKTTISGYKKLGAYALRYFKDTPLLQMTKMVRAIQAAVNELSLKGGLKEKPLSPKTVGEIHHLMNAIYEYAVRMQQVNPITNPNPMKSIILPKRERKKAKHLEMFSLRQLLEDVEDHLWLGPLVNLDLPTGCRRGELLAVRWDDLDYNTRILMFNKSLGQTPEDGIFLKATKEGDIRPLKLPHATIAYLKRHKERQDAHRAKMGSLYRSDLNLIVCDEYGEFLRPASVSAKMSHLLQHKMGLPKGHSLHSLRHSSGSHLLSDGAPLSKVSQRLGHANTQITADLYVHPLEADDPVMDEALERLVVEAQGGAKVNKPRRKDLPKVA